MMLHILFPKLCVSSCRWVGDWLICSKCGQRIGFKYMIPNKCLDYDRNTGEIVYRDNLETKVMLFYPFVNMIDT